MRLSDQAPRLRIVAAGNNRITGRPRSDSTSLAHSSIPFISGMCTSTRMHALVLGMSLASNALGRLKLFTLRPADLISLATAGRKDGSSSTKSTVGSVSTLFEFAAFRPAARCLLEVAFTCRDLARRLIANILLTSSPPGRMTVFFSSLRFKTSPQVATCLAHQVGIATFWSFSKSAASPVTAWSFRTAVRPANPITESGRMQITCSR